MTISSPLQNWIIVELQLQLDGKFICKVFRLVDVDRFCRKNCKASLSLYVDSLHTVCTVNAFSEIAHFVRLIKRAHLDNFHRSPQLGGFEMKTLIRWEAKSVTEQLCHLLRFIRLSPSFLKIMIVFLYQPLL